jgi:hypothetical protein
MVSVALHSAKLATTSAVRPPNGVASDLRRDDLLLAVGQQPLPCGPGQLQLDDITEIIRPADLQDVSALFLTVSSGFHQPHNPSHAPTPDQRSDQKLPLRRPHLPISRQSRRRRGAWPQPSTNRNKLHRFLRLADDGVRADLGSTLVSHQDLFESYASHTDGLALLGN